MVFFFNRETLCWSPVLFTGVTPTHRLEIFVSVCVCFEQDVSLSRIVAGLDLHRDLLQDIRERSSSTEELSLLLADITDLSAQVHQVLASDALASLTNLNLPTAQGCVFSMGCPLFSLRCSSWPRFPAQCPRRQRSQRSLHGSAVIIKSKWPSIFLFSSCAASHRTSSAVCATLLHQTSWLFCVECIFVRLTGCKTFEWVILAKFELNFGITVVLNWCFYGNYLKYLLFI